jgi:enoyl-CoA hydratase/carnithine racemase
MAGPIEVETADGVATVTVDNPPVNALDDATLAGLGDAARGLAADDEVRAVVLTGAGERAFLAGADLAAIRDHLGVAGGMDDHVALTRPTFEAWRLLPQPVIAAVQAHAVGGGLEFALICDLIVADRKAKLGVPEVTLGLIPGGGGTQRLPRRVAPAVAREMLLLGGLIDAGRAREIGIVNEVTEPGAAVDRAHELALRLAALPAVAVRAIKAAARASAEVGLDEGLDLERDLFLEAAASADAREGADAFLGRRRPKFRNR